MKIRLPSLDHVAWAFHTAPGGDGSSRSPVPSKATTCVFEVRPLADSSHIQYAMWEPSGDQLAPARAWPVGISWIGLTFSVAVLTANKPRSFPSSPMNRISAPLGGR